MSLNCYGIMIKYPEPGRVKTRLAKDIGDRKAAQVCRRLAERAMTATTPYAGEFSRVVFHYPPDRLGDFNTWFPAEPCIAQRGGDVGERMNNVILDLLAMGAEKAVITGADIPDLNAKIISAAFAALDNTDIVIGPAADGGYYLIGMKKPHAEIFEGIAWSTDTVLDETLHALRRLRLSHIFVTTLSDLDTPDDYNRFLMRAAHQKPETCA